MRQRYRYPLAYIDDDPNNNTLAPNHLIYGRNIHEKCYEYKSEDFTENDARSSSKCTANIICKFFQKFDNEYIVSLQERYFIINENSKTNVEHVSVTSF